jgi:hypothetical protein
VFLEDHIYAFVDVRHHLGTVAPGKIYGTEQFAYKMQFHQDATTDVLKMVVEVLRPHISW